MRPGTSTNNNKALAFLRFLIIAIFPRWGMGKPVYKSLLNFTANQVKDFINKSREWLYALSQKHINQCILHSKARMKNELQKCRAEILRWWRNCLKSSDSISFREPIRNQFSTQCNHGPNQLQVSEHDLRVEIGIEKTFLREKIAVSPIWDTRSAVNYNLDITKSSISLDFPLIHQWQNSLD